MMAKASRVIPVGRCVLAATANPVGTLPTSRRVIGAQAHSLLVECAGASAYRPAMLNRLRIGLLASVLLAVPLAAAEPSTDGWLDKTRARWVAVAQKIWETPETALEEKRSSATLAAELEKEGFRITWGIGGEATAFAA